MCLEVTKNKVSKVYAYASIEAKSQSFNAFFEVNKEVKTINQLDVNKDMMMQFLKLGTSDLSKIRELGKTYNRPIPTEMKMYYDVKTGKYNADYKYEEICSAKTGLDVGTIFMDWYNQIRND